MPDPSEPSHPAAGTPAPDAQCGMVAIVGRANVGKSTLINAILGEKISIVSPVAQTTRNTIRGVLTDPRGQLVFLDTPGVHRTSYDLGRLMNRQARASTEGVDIALLVVDASARPEQEDAGWMSRLKQEGTPCFIALNKMDLGGTFRAAYQETWAQAGPEACRDRTARWFELSAETGEGLVPLVSALFAAVPVGPQLFPADVLTDFPRKLAVADIIREKLFRSLYQELPHSVAVWVEEIREEEDGWRVSGTIYVQKDSQKGIVIGEKGRLLRKVRRAAEKELAALYGTPAHLDLWVKVEKNWTRNFWMLKKLGYA